MKKLLLATAIGLLLFGDAAAQNPMCPDRAPGDSTNACANTRFVQQHTSPPTPPGGSNGQVQYNNNGVFGGLSDAQLTARINQFTISLPGAVPGSGGGTTNFLRADGTWAAPPVPSSCPPGWFCVSEYNSLADAVTALNSAGGGVLYVDENVTISSAQEIGTNTDVICKPGVLLATTSTTEDLLTVTGALVNIQNCEFAFSGTVGTKTSGALVNLTGHQAAIRNSIFREGCFYCIQVDCAVAELTGVVVHGNISDAPVNGASAVKVTLSAVLYVAQMLISASAAGNSYSYNFDVNDGALTIVNLHSLNGVNNFHIAPFSDRAVFVKMTASYLDTCVASCLLIDTSSGGAVGYAEFVGVEFITNSATQPSIFIDAGNVNRISISDSIIESYVASPASAISFTGSINILQVMGNDLGVNMDTGIFFALGSTVNLIANGNNFRAAVSAVFNSAGTGLLNPVAQGNRFNGGAWNHGGASTTYVVNNVP